MDELVVPRILQCISTEDYSQEDLVASLQEQKAADENAFAQTFLQFLVDCAEIPNDVHPGMDFPGVIIGSGQGPRQFLVYRTAQLNEPIESLLQVYLSDMRPFESDVWTENVMELLNAMIDAGDQLSVCALYFVARLLLYCTSIRDCNRMNADVPLDNFCRFLWEIYDFDLLVDDNFIDITQKLIYMFQFHWQVVLGGNRANAKHLTGLLLIDYNHLKRDVLKTIDAILNVPNLDTNIRDSIMDELVLLKDVLLAMCYYEPYHVAIGAVSLIEAHSEFLLSQPNSFFALMANPKSKIQELAKKSFLHHVEHKSEVGRPAAIAFLETLESCVTASKDALNWLDDIAALLADQMPSFIDIYLFIVQRNSKAISRISTVLVKLLIEKSSEGTDAETSLLDITTVSKSALQQISITGNWCIYQNLLTNLQLLPESIFDTTPDGDLDTIADHLINTIGMEELPSDGQAIMGSVLVRIMKCRQTLSELPRILEQLTNNFTAMGSLLEAALLLDFYDEDDNFNELQSVANNTLIDDCYDSPEDLVYIQHLLIMKMTDATEVMAAGMELLHFIAIKLLQPDESTASELKLTTVLKATVNVLLKVTLFLGAASEDQVVFINDTANRLFAWIRASASQDVALINIWQEYTLTLLQFSLVWLRSNEFPKLMEVILMFPDTRKQVSTFVSTIMKNRRCELSQKISWLTETIPKTLHGLNRWKSKPQVTAASKMLLNAVTTEVSNASEDLANIFNEILIRSLVITKDFLSDNANPPFDGAHRFQSLDWLVDKSSGHINSGDRRLILTILGEVVKIPLSDVEKMTMGKLVTILH